MELPRAGIALVWILRVLWMSLNAEPFLSRHSDALQKKGFYQHLTFSSQPSDPDLPVCLHISVFKCTHLGNDQIRLRVVAVHHTWTTYHRTRIWLLLSYTREQHSVCIPATTIFICFSLIRAHTIATTYQAKPQQGDARHCSCLISCISVVQRTVLWRIPELNMLCPPHTLASLTKAEGLQQFDKYSMWEATAQ